MTEFWMGVGMIAGAPVFGFVSALLAVAPIYWALGRVLKKMPEEDRAENKEKVDSIVASLVFAVFSFSFRNSSKLINSVIQYPLLYKLF